MNKWVEKLLNELCVEHGFCLPPDASEQLERNPPQSIDAFTEAVFIAEGLNPKTDKKLFHAIRARVAERFRLYIPAAIAEDIGPFLDELAAVGIAVTQVQYDDQSLGNYSVDLDISGAALRINRNRGQYLLEAPIDRLKALGLFRAINSREELRTATLTYVRAVADANTLGSA